MFVCVVSCLALLCDECVVVRLCLSLLVVCVVVDRIWCRWLVVVVGL